MFTEVDLNDLKIELEEEFSIAVGVDENKLYIEDVNGEYFFIENLAESISYYIEANYDCFTNYILDCNGFFIEIF